MLFNKNTNKCHQIFFETKKNIEFRLRKIFEFQIIGTLEQYILLFKGWTKFLGILIYLNSDIINLLNVCIRENDWIYIIDIYEFAKNKSLISKRIQLL